MKDKSIINGTNIIWLIVCAKNNPIITDMIGYKKSNFTNTVSCFKKSLLSHWSYSILFYHKCGSLWRSVKHGENI